MVVRAVDETGQIQEHFLAVRFGATERDWEEVADESHIVELLDGLLIVHSPISNEHAEVFEFLHALLVCYVKRRGLGTVRAGPFAMDVSAERKFEPDIFFLAEASTSRIEADRLVGPADLVIEIISPSTGAYDRGEKREAYAEAGIREYWIIDPWNRMVTVEQPAGVEIATFRTGQLKSVTCLGLWIDVEWLWQRPTPDVIECAERVLADVP